MMENKVLRKWLLGFIHIHILHHAKERTHIWFMAVKRTEETRLSDERWNLVSFTAQDGVSGSIRKRRKNCGRED